MNTSTSVLGKTEIVRSAWTEQATWSGTASRLKRGLSRWRTAAAVAGVLGAFLETLAAALPKERSGSVLVHALLAIGGAIVLAVVPYVVRTKVSKEQIRNWVRARSASEALKETIFRYLVGAAPFGMRSSPTDLVSRSQEIEKTVEDLAVYGASVVPGSKERPITLTIDEYVEKRLVDQVENYYRPKGRQNAIVASRLHNIEFILGLLAVVMGAMASASATKWLPGLSLLGPWIGVVTTAGAAVTAHLAAARYDYAALTYFGTANRLNGLRQQWLAASNRLDPTQVAKLVDDCEHAISTENEAWLADWIKEKGN